MEVEPGGGVDDGVDGGADRRTAGFVHSRLAAASGGDEFEHFAARRRPDALGGLARAPALALDQVVHRGEARDRILVVETVARGRARGRDHPERRSHTRMVGMAMPVRSAACLMVYMLCLP